MSLQSNTSLRLPRPSPLSAALAMLTKLSEALDEAWVLAGEARKRHSLAE